MLFVGGPLHGMNHDLDPGQLGRAVIAMDDEFFRQMHRGEYPLTATPSRYEHVYVPRRITRPVRTGPDTYQEVTRTFYVSGHVPQATLTVMMDDAIVNAWFMPPKEEDTVTGVNVSAAFPKDEQHYNGLEAIAEDLVKDRAPLTRHVIVAVVERCRLTIDDRRGGQMTPTIRLVTVEVMQGDDAETARGMLNARYRERTGATEDPQMSLFEGDGRSIDDLMNEAGHAPPPREEPPGQPQRDPTAGPWPGDADYQAASADAPSEHTDAPDDPPGASGPERTRGRRSR